MRNVSSRTMNVEVIEKNSNRFKELDKAQSINVGLPDKFTVPAEPQYVVMTFKTLIDPATKQPRQALGVVINVDEEEKPVSISSLSRKFFDEKIEKEVTEDGSEHFATSGKSQRAIIDVFQDVNTMNLSPSDIVSKLAGKEIEKSGEATFWVGEFDRATNSIIGYSETTKSVFTCK